MVQKIKEPKLLEKDLEHLVSRTPSFPVAVMDTSAFIDITQSVRRYDLLTRKNGGEKIYSDTLSYLNYLSQMVPLIVIPGVQREILKHKNTRLNGYRYELDPGVVDHVSTLGNKSAAFLSGVANPLEEDSIRWDVYWASKECCKNNSKKYKEEFSETDLSILYTGAFLSGGLLKQLFNKKVGPVVMVSPDAHIREGVNFLNREFDERYTNLFHLSTRK